MNRIDTISTQDALPRSAQINSYREEIFERRPMPRAIASRTIVIGDRIIHQVLMDYGRVLGRGKCSWTPDIQSFGV